MSFCSPENVLTLACRTHIGDRCPPEIPSVLARTAFSDMKHAGTVS